MLHCQLADSQRLLKDALDREAALKERLASSTQTYEGRLVVLQSQVDDLLAESVQIRADAELLSHVRYIGTMWSLCGYRCDELSCGNRGCTVDTCCATGK